MQIINSYMSTTITKYQLSWIKCFFIPLIIWYSISTTVLPLLPNTLAHIHWRNPSLGLVKARIFAKATEANQLSKVSRRQHTTFCMNLNYFYKPKILQALWRTMSAMLMKLQNFQFYSINVEWNIRNKLSLITISDWFMNVILNSLVIDEDLRKFKMFIVTQTITK